MGLNASSASGAFNGAVKAYNPTKPHISIFSALNHFKPENNPK